MSTYTTLSIIIKNNTIDETETSNIIKTNFLKHPYDFFGCSLDKIKEFQDKCCDNFIHNIAKALSKASYKNGYFNSKSILTMNFIFCLNTPRNIGIIRLMSNSGLYLQDKRYNNSDFNVQYNNNLQYRTLINQVEEFSNYIDDLQLEDVYIALLNTLLTMRYDEEYFYCMVQFNRSLILVTVKLNDYWNYGMENLIEY